MSDGIKEEHIDDILRGGSFAGYLDGQEIVRVRGGRCCGFRRLVVRQD